jgi:membrane associated rhomboid family serine protease
LAASTILPILQRGSALWKTFAGSEDSVDVIPISGSGRIPSALLFDGSAISKRFITPIFIHAGLIHILLNMVAQLLLSARVEKDMGSGGFFVLYFAAGIFGYELVSHCCIAF